MGRQSLFLFSTLIFILHNLIKNVYVLAKMALIFGKGGEYICCTYDGLLLVANRGGQKWMLTLMITHWMGWACFTALKMLRKIYLNLFAHAAISEAYQLTERAKKRAGSANQVNGLIGIKRESNFCFDKSHYYIGRRLVCVEHHDAWRIHDWANIKSCLILSFFFLG